jgi:formylglycine-generating enzyme required for sulfatase activity
MPAGSIAKAITNGIGMALVWIAGLPGSGAGGWVGQCEVTEAEYQKLTGSNPSKSVEPDQPVENVTWVEAGDFCRKLTAAEHASGRLPREFAYSLPTQQQWDFFLDDAGYDSAVTSRDLPSPRSAPSRVGSLPPNRFGLCDVLGNVWEWCADSESADLKVLKGGAYDNGRIFQFKPLDRTTPRRLPAGARAADAGFRCVVVEQPGAGTAGPR